MNNMSVKDNFTAEEWQTLLKLPFKLGVTLMVVAPSGPIGLTKETMALAKVPFALAQASSANALVSALAVELQAQAKDIVKAEESSFKHSDPITYKGQTMAACKTAAAALGKASAEDAGAYRTWVLAVGQQVAEAAKENGVLFSDQEKALLKELGEALGTTA
jgi:branched-subunit amino acid aminotransferase/4-amino-4-deoxychorismate lyase